MGILLALLWGANDRFWSCLGCLCRKVTYLLIQVSLKAMHKEINKKYCVSVLVWSPLI